MAEQTDRPGEVELVPREAPSARPQPDSVESRPYLEIRPAETPVDPGAAAHAMGTIDALLRDTARGGLIRKLRGTTLTPVVEWLLVSDGRPDPAIRYLVGSNVSDLTEDLEGGYSIEDRRTRRALTEDMTVRFAEPGPVYEVDSESGNSYRVDLTAETCSCPDHAKRETFCKHLRRVDLEIRAGVVPGPDGRFVR